jgi:hypothetical protein
MTHGKMFNVTLTVADTEYSQALPDRTRKIMIQARTSAAVRWSWDTGKVATPVAPYFTVKAGDTYYDNDLMLNKDTKLYLASSTGGTVVEIQTWD